MSSKMGYQKSRHRQRKGVPASIAQFPAQPPTVATRREQQGRCPECGRTRACYSCATQGGWVSEAEAEEHANIQDPVEP